MKKLNLKTVKHISIGLILGIFMTSTTPVIAQTIQQKIEVILNDVNIKINNTVLANKNENYTLSNGNKIPYSILYKDTTYLPMRIVAESVGKEVSWDNITGTAVINDIENNDVKKDEVSNIIEYEDKEYTFKRYSPFSGNVLCTTYIYSFKLENPELSYDGKSYLIECSGTGKFIGETEYFSFKVECYDKDGFLLVTDSVSHRGSSDKDLKFTGTIRCPKETVKIKLIPYN